MAFPRLLYSNVNAHFHDLSSVLRDCLTVENTDHIYHTEKVSPLYKVVVQTLSENALL